MTWTGLHVPDPKPVKKAPAQRLRIDAPAPCEACSDRQQRACSAGPLTCSAYIRFQLRGGCQTRDVDAEPALAELTPLLDCDPRGAKAITAVLRRASAISAASVTDGQEQPTPPPARQPKPRKRPASEAAILSALSLCDGTVRELVRVCKLGEGTARAAIAALLKRGELVAVTVPNPRQLGPRTCMAVRRPA
jgi:phage tail tape-measure protein